MSNDNSIGSNASDPFLKELIKEDTDKEVQRLEAINKVSVHKWRLALLANMKNEDIKQTIENLANFDDMFASSNIQDIGISSMQSTLVTRLMCVRKLYAIGLDNPDLIIQELSRVQKDSFEK